MRGKKGGMHTFRALPRVPRLCGEVGWRELLHMLLGDPGPLRRELYRKRATPPFHVQTLMQRGGQFGSGEYVVK
jgi:hypothetical protein